MCVKTFFLGVIRFYHNNESNFYKSLNPDNKDHINLFKKIVNAFSNFKKYLLTNNSVIDYTYLWDIVCKPNPKLFKNGINLLILDSEENTILIITICLSI